MFDKKNQYVLLFVFVIAVIAGLLFSAARRVFVQKQYKRVGRNAISSIMDAKYKPALTKLERYLSVYPKDLESLFCMAVLYTQKSEIKKAMEYVRKAVKDGLPFDRFLAGPRDLLKPLYDSEEFKSFAVTRTVELLHGPLLGCVTSNSAKFWVRTVHEVMVRVIVSCGGTVVKKSEEVKTESSSDFTALLLVNGLSSLTRYEYSIIVDGKKYSGDWSFRTFPSEGEKIKLQVGFGGGAGFTPEHERMWNTIHSHNLIAFLFLGDNVYIDDPKKPDVQRYCYYRRQSREEFRRFISSSSIYAVWDDHDFTTNDSWGGPGITTPPWKIPVWKIFRENWNNPYYAGGDKQPGCWFDFSIGDVDFFMLDSRYYRMNPRKENSSMLGPVQKKWLLKKLKASKAVFKIIASPVPWAFGSKPGSRDPWQGYREEREDIFSFIETNRINGVILLSADRHRSDVWKISREKGYDFYEFESSKLTNIHTHGKMKGALFSYNEKCSFGILSFDTTLKDPEVTYTIFNIDNELIHEQKVKKSQLREP